MGAIDSGLDRAADATHTEAHPFRHLWKRSQRLSAALEPGEKIVVLLGEPGAIRFATGHSSRSKEMCSPSSIAAALKRGKNTAGSSERSRLQSCGPRSDAWSTVTQRSLTRAYTASLSCRRRPYRLQRVSTNCYLRDKLMGFDQLFLLLWSRSLGASGRQASFVKSPPSCIQSTFRQVTLSLLAHQVQRWSPGMTCEPQQQTSASPYKDDIGFGVPGTASFRHKTSRQCFRHHCLSTSLEQL